MSNIQKQLVPEFQLTLTYTSRECIFKATYITFHQPSDTVGAIGHKSLTRAEQEASVPEHKLVK